MDPVLLTLLINAGLVLTGALLRGHAPRLWPVLAPIFGVATRAATSPPPPPPPAPPAAGAPIPVTRGPSLPPSLLAALQHVPEPTEEDELEDVLHRYVSKQQQGRRLAALLHQAHVANSRKTGEPSLATFPPKPSVN